MYLDTCTLVDALLEPAKALSSVPESQKARTRERHLARKIADKWLPSHLILSPYVIGEFLEVAVRGFSRKDADAQTVLVNFVRRGVNVKYAELDLRLARIYDATGMDPRLLLSLRLEGSATGSDGRRYSGAGGGFRLYRSGQTVDFASVGGLAADAPLPEHRLAFDADAVTTVSAPAIELAFFHTVAGLVATTSVNWKDAFHYLYAKWADAQAVLSTDEEFRKTGGKVKGFPPVYKPFELEEELAHRHPELHTLIFGDG